MITLIPAYGRDYKSKKAVQEDLDNNKDFEVASLGQGGRYANASDLLNDNQVNVTIRYGKLRKVGIFSLKASK